MREQRQYIEVTGRLVHFRSWGSGPVILALHGSPQSSRAVSNFSMQLAEQGFRVIAPDTPGNGLSQPLPGANQASIASYAHALHDLVEALKLERFALYGFHTGAAVACCYAALYPEHVTALLCDGLPNWSARDRESLESYLPTFEASWDGSHMAWLWARVEEQSVFFPWHRTLSDYRMTYDVTPTTACHANVIDMLLAGNHYMAPYRAALLFTGDSWLARVRCAKLCVAHHDDPLYQHIASLPCLDEEKASFDSPTALLSLSTALFQKYPGSSTLQFPATQNSESGFFDCEVGRLAWHQTQAELGHPLVLLHDAGDSSVVFEQIMEALPRRVLSIDLPGHGHSDAPNKSFDIDAIARAIHENCRSLGIESYRVAGEGVGAYIAASLLHQGFTDQVLAINSQVDIDHCCDPVTGEPIKLELEWDGSHLLRAWRIARWGQLFSPWNQRQRQYAIRVPGSLDSTAVQARALSLLQAGKYWYDAIEAASQSGPLNKNSSLTLASTTYSNTTAGSLQIPANRAQWIEILSAF